MLMVAYSVNGDAYDEATPVHLTHQPEGDHVLKYQTIVADPPWDYGKDNGRFPVNVGNENKHEPLPYSTMTTAEIAALPVADWAFTDCRLFLWATNRHIHDAFHVAEAWGFVYRQMLVWEKTRSTPIGSVAPTRAEFMLVCKRGAPTTMQRFPSSVILASPGHHSQKPEAFLDYIEACSPPPRLEMFARRARFGWDVWGNEAPGPVALENA